MQEKFFQRLDEIGGAPQGWIIYPHVCNDQALHIAPSESLQAVVDHLAHFDGFYEYGEIVEVHPVRQ
jgi:hypothetical protein